MTKKAKTISAVAAGLLVLASCANTPGTSGGSSSSGSAEEFNLAETLQALAGGYHLTATYTETTVDGTDEYTEDVYSLADKITFLVDMEGQDYLNETYVQADEDELQATRLGIDNDFNYYDYYNPAAEDFYKFAADGFSNYFASLSAADFSLNEGTFELKSVGDDAEQAIVTQLYGNPGFDLVSYKITPGEEGVDVDVSFAFETSYTYTLSGTYEAITGDDFVYAYPPYETIEDEVFDNTKASLKNHDFVLTQISDSSEYDSVLICNDEGIYYKTYNDWEEELYEYFYYPVGEGLVQEAVKSGDYWIKSNEPMEGSLEELGLYPSLNYDRAVFDEVSDGKYELKKGIDGGISTFTIFAADDGQKLTLEIGNGVMDVTTTGGDISTMVEFSDIGSATLPVTPDEVLDEIPSQKFADLLEQATVDTLLTVMSQEDLDNFPVISGFNGPNWVDWTEDPMLPMLVYGDESADAEAGVAAYAEALEALGYTPFADSLNGGAAFTKETTLDDGVHAFYVEAVNDGYLILVFFDMANIDNL